MDKELEKIFRNMQITCMDEMQCQYTYRKGFARAGSCMDCKAYKKAISQLKTLFKKKARECVGKDEPIQVNPKIGDTEKQRCFIEGFKCGCHVVQNDTEKNIDSKFK